MARANEFKISAAPIAAAGGGEGDAEDRETSLTGNRPLPTDGPPLFRAIPRNPRTLFICWNVNWAEAFREKAPIDRRVHVRLRSGEKEITVAVEPMLGSCSIGELVPGETCFAELGYYAPANFWNAIARSPEVTMPFESESAEGPVEVASIPFHLEFQRILEAFAGANKNEMARALAALEQRASGAASLSLEDEQRLRQLGLSREELRERIGLAEALSRARTIRDRTHAASSPQGGSWSS